MTITAIITDIILGILIILGAIGIAINSYENEFKNGIISFVIGMFILLIIIGGQLFYFKKTESGKRALKTQQSELGSGIEREIKVYDVTGNEIEVFRGKFDIEYDNDRILFDDEKGNRHIIFYPTGTIIINELKN